MKVPNRYISFIVVCLQLIPQVGWGEETASHAQRWPIDRILSRATERTPELKALAQDIERAENLARQAGQWENPDASLSYGPMSQQGLSGIAIEATLLQNIPLFGQKALAERVGLQTKTTIEAESNQQILVLNHEVVRLAYRLAALEEQAEHVAHRREKINLVAEYLKTRPFASPAQAVEKNLVLNRLREIEEQFLSISSARENAWRALNIFLALETPITPDARWLQKPKLPDREKLFQSFQTQNPELVRQESLIRTAELEADLAGKKALPDIRLGGRYIEQTADFPQKIYTGMLEFTIPILDRGGYAKRAALAEKAASTYRLQHKKRELEARFEQAWTALLQNQKRVELFPLALVTNMEREMAAAEKNWKKGLVQVTAFLELENQVHEQAFKVFDAQAGYIEALSQMELLAGMRFEAEGK